jgi:ribosomal protein S7
MELNTITYFQNIKQFFLRKGKKNRMESLMHDFLIKRAKTNKGDISAVLKSCILNSTPYIRLKVRRRGKKVRYKIGFLEKEKAERKALSALSKNFKDQTATRFSTGLEKELEMLASGKSNLTLKRDELHKLALLNSPYRWRRNNKKIKK